MAYLNFGLLHCCLFLYVSTSYTDRGDSQGTETDLQGSGVEVGPGNQEHGGQGCVFLDLPSHRMKDFRKS